jgi:phage gpG-like protein
MAGYAERATFAEFARKARAGRYGAAVAPAGRQTAPAPAKLPPATGKVVGQIVVSDIKGRIAAGVDVRGQRFRPLKHARPRGGNKPLLDRGLLLASFTSRVEPDAVVVGSNHPGAAANNFGAVIRAKKKMLAIPLTKEAVRAGSPRRFKRKELTLQPTRKRRVFLLMSTDKAGRRVPQFLLVDSVKVPQREFMGVSDKALLQVADALALAGLRPA